MKEKLPIGHLTALFTITVWGTTFIVTKVLLESFSPIEILVFRFLIAIVVLLLVYPKLFGWRGWKQERYFLLAGLCGVTLYYLFENLALNNTNASNVSVIISISPFFTGICARIQSKESKLTPKFFFGFLIALAGVYLISFQGNFSFEINPLGDLLALVSAFAWAVYSLTLKKIGTFHYPAVQTTRRIMMYGLICLLPALFFLDFKPSLSKFTTATVLNLLFLGLFASALCFLSWNFTIKKLGPIKSSVYVYIVPVITIAASAIILKEEITAYSLVGTVLALSGLLLSQINFRRRERPVNA